MDTAKIVEKKFACTQGGKEFIFMLVRHNNSENEVFRVLSKSQEASKRTKLAMMKDLLWKESIAAVKLSSEFSDFKAFRSELEKALPQNSSAIRARYTQMIIRWFFPTHSIDNLLTKVWTFYKDELLLREIMRYQYLTIEPVVREFVIQNVLTRPPGSVLKIDYLKDFLMKKYGVVKKHPLTALSSAIRYIGLASRGKNGIVISEISIPKTALLILTHHIFAPTPRTVTVKEILSNCFWWCLGIRDSETVKKTLHEADANGIITKYIVADQLEQITTKYSFDEFVQRKIRL